MTAFLTVAGKLISLFIYIIVGYAIRKFDIVTKEFASGISAFLMKLTLPCIILITFQTDYTPELLAEAGQTYFLGIGAYLLSILIGYLSFHMFSKKTEEKGVWVYSVVFPNQGFMGWPVITAILGSEAIFHATFANMAFSTFAYTWGVWFMHATGSNREVKQSLKKELLTPINISILVGMILFITQLKIPTPINNAIDGISGLTSPLAMIYIGTILSNVDLKSILTDRRVYIVSALRLLLIPAIVLLILRPFGLPAVVFGTTVISAAMPVAGYTAIYAGAYGNDVELASKFISFSSLLSVITIPIFALLL